MQGNGGSLEDPRSYLVQIPRGEIQNTAHLEQLLAACWHEFTGSLEGGMAGHKLRGRMEHVSWDPPVLSFTIERHGSTAMGSTRAEIQKWFVNFETAASSLHTRYPVSQDGTVEGIAGYVNFKEIVAMMPSRREAQIQPFIRPLSRLAATASLNEALKSLLGHREHMALVEDEQHRIVGLVTLEDLLEEIVGDLTDEFDQLSDEIIEVADRRWKIGGGARLSRVAGQTGLVLGASETEALLSELVAAKSGAGTPGGRHGPGRGRAVHRHSNPPTESSSRSGGGSLTIP